ncbi:unnamed protein product [Candidula unifasciata]|uniref:beta-N-acetylhexosaminidase n=1 Tax=Candidula unifasciata TaxID=100452 RepID=A0A8S4AAA5_9EUPU|nr:unnamed protein product [Candidula unifasciata]
MDGKVLPSMADEPPYNLESRLVHLDLKGAPLSVGYLEKVFPLLKSWGATGLLIEYEDTFPYSEDLRVLRAAHAYSEDDLRQILKNAEDFELEVIPLVQTFGHLEFVLKHEPLAHLREIAKYPMALCPSNPESLHLVVAMIDQVMRLHTGIKYFHIGCDEVYHLGICEACKHRMMQESIGKDQLFFSHVHKVATHIQNTYPSVTTIMWDDMFRYSELPVILDCGLGKLVEPMVWHYLPNFVLPPDIWNNLSAVFPNIWIASAFKGATGPRTAITNIRYHLDNHGAWLDALRVMKHKFKSIKGIALTGWQRYDHYSVLCELFPHGLPSLGLCLKFIQQGVLSPVDFDAVARDMKFATLIPINPFASADIAICNFPGSLVYQLMIEFVHKEAVCKEFFMLDSMAAWMNDYNVERGFINPAHVEPLLNRGISLLDSLQILEERLDAAFPDVFVSGVKEEWKGEFLSPWLKKLEEFVDKGRRIVSGGKVTEVIDSEVTEIIEVTEVVDNDVT